MLPSSENEKTKTENGLDWDDETKLKKKWKTKDFKPRDGKFQQVIFLKNLTVIQSIFSNLSDVSEEEDPTEATLIYETKNVSKNSNSEKKSSNIEQSSSTIEKESCYQNLTVTDHITKSNLKVNDC